MADVPKAVGDSAQDAETELFFDARVALRSYLVAKDELQWRLLNLYNKSDVFVRAVEGLCGMGDFQSCADECACAFARARGRDVFVGLGLEHWMDVFYGEAWRGRR
jgi:hypothetical protein